MVRVGIVVGLLLRVYHYARCPAVWHDEAACLTNVLNLSYREMLGPLRHAEAAPPLFLILERLLVDVVGDGEYPVRFIPFLASCLALVLFAHLAQMVRPGWPAAVAVALFATSDRLLWHACEAKPYALDAFVAVLAAWWVVWSESWPLWKRAWPVILLAPMALWMSFPACFILGGLLIALGLPILAQTVTRRDVAMYGLMAMVIGGAFVALALGPAAAQRNDAMDACWVGHFPNWSRPAMVPVWAIVGTFEVARYCFLPLGQPILILAGIGAWVLWKERRPLVLTLVVPLGLALVAALLMKYPFGGSRLEVFACGGLALLAAVALPKFQTVSPILLYVTLAVLALPVGWGLSRTIWVWDRAATDQASAWLLRERDSRDRILTNHWDYDYYFRRTENWRLWTGPYDPDDLTGDRVWIVLNLDRETEQFPFPPPVGWRIDRVQTFPRVSVFGLTRDGTMPLPDK